MSSTVSGKVSEFIAAVSSLNVAVVGETIIDEFVEVEYEGHSMKSFCPVFRLEEGRPKQEQQGGAAAIAGHLRDFVKNLDLVSNSNGEIIKTRYIDRSDKKKHVEINRFNKAAFKPVKIDTRDYDVVIVADFGHGFCDNLEITGGFHLMCQTNSNNFGFNRVSKWKKHRKKSVTLDLREASLQMNRSIAGATDADILELFNYEMNTGHMFVTLGKSGSLYSDGNRIVRQPSFKSNIVDTIGAGDTFYAFCSLLAHIDPQVNDIVVPSLAASLSTTWLCNERSVTKASLLDYANKSVQ
jgi:bifunctional ADP-heptose synthase (sugar kinase/adenylyltransferase)